MIDKPAIGAPCNGCGLCCLTRVCGAGSFALGLVDRYGERVDGPCPALEAEGATFVCGLVKRPKYYLPRNPRGPTVLREAFKILIGAGIGCDEAGDEPDDTAMPKLENVQRDFARRYTRQQIEKAMKAAYDVDA